MTQEIANLLIALIPSLTGIIGIVSSVLVCVTKVKNLTDKSASEITELRDKLKQSSTLNIALQKQIDGLTNQCEAIAVQVKEKIDAQVAEAKEIARINIELVKENESLKQLAVEDAKVKQQLTALLKKGK